MRLAPILGVLALLAIISGALGCHWGANASQSGQSVTAQSAPSAHPAAAVVFVVAPLAIVGVVVAAGWLRATRSPPTPPQ